ncbi:hypothetical protein GCM10018793_53020 [Streptomyces sulfonofaciens]|uniref:Uncharacterized protein n=1 Tax=Streptomyces sulfonofaciens TaxID=68272 RepID=A0A919GJZ4_9ACTN|nr:hypothetical protein [Streptomyces sulfonofaciens]GHH85366.1 hypothetical protein GCM10018793_53020 [Streptomyces sulfonofaciens]
MESVPAVFAGVVFTLFGAALLVWTAMRLRHGEPVAEGVNPIASATVATLAGVAAVSLGFWCLSRI